jgi:DNA modification methylase
MKKTKTSSFGVGKRESHDSSPFYNRSIFDSVYKGIFAQELSSDQIASIQIPPVGTWVNEIYCRSSENMSVIPDNSIGLVFTSPPYNVGKDYDNDITLRKYLNLIENVGREVYRVLRPGGRYVINIANLGRKPYIPLHAFFYDLHLKIGFLPMGEVIWQKGDGATGSTAWGSWASAKAPRLRDVHEYLLVFAKQSFSRPDIGKSDIHPTEFMDATLSIWKIASESATRVQHPAPFPIKLAERVIELYSYRGDVVLDPFVGSGSTCVAAANKRRFYVGFDISSEYCKIARKRVEGKGKLYMPSEKTEASEISVAFGILNIDDPTSLSDKDVNRFFQGSLSSEKYARFKQEFTNPKNNRLYKRLLSLGNKLRSTYTLFSNVNELQWSGPRKQAKAASEAEDLIVANTPVSIKASSNLLDNFSPFRIFQSIPSGTPPPDRSENWFFRTDPKGYQDLYAAVRNIRLDHFPKTVKNFESVANTNMREEIEEEISKLSGRQLATFNKLKVEMYRTIASKSANTFNANYKKSMLEGSRTAIKQEIVRYLFRLGTKEYVLVGTDNTKSYAVLLPSLNQWIKDWEIIQVVASPDLEREQSIVNLAVEYRNKVDKTLYTANFHVEIRWSHGKFRQSPEAKLYKDFKWADIRFVQPVI